MAGQPSQPNSTASTGSSRPVNADSCGFRLWRAKPHVRGPRKPASSGRPENRPSRLPGKKGLPGGPSARQKRRFGTRPDSPRRFTGMLISTPRIRPDFPPGADRYIFGPQNLPRLGSTRNSPLAPTIPVPSPNCANPSNACRSRRERARIAPSRLRTPHLHPMADEPHAGGWSAERSDSVAVGELFECASTAHTSATGKTAFRGFIRCGSRFRTTTCEEEG